MRQVEGSRALSFVEKEAMAPCTVGGLTHGMAHGNHIRLESYEFTSVGGPAPVSAFSHFPNLSSRDLDPAIYGGNTLGTTLSGSILEFTYIGGPVPSFAMIHGQVFYPGGHRPMAQGELT